MFIFFLLFNLGTRYSQRETCNAKFQKRFFLLERSTMTANKTMEQMDRDELQLTLAVVWHGIEYTHVFG